MNPNPDFFRVIAVTEPRELYDLFIVDILLKNMKGEEKKKVVTFSSSGDAFNFYLTQKKMLKSK